MIETRSKSMNSVPECSVSSSPIRPEPEYPEWEPSGDIPPRVVALERLWYYLKVLVSGKLPACEDQPQEHGSV
jgi:hypothetical protein